MTVGGGTTEGGQTVVDGGAGELVVLWGGFPLLGAGRVTPASCVGSWLAWERWCVTYASGDTVG